MSYMGIPVMTMGYSIESVDICFGNQLADSRGDIGGILCTWVGTCFCRTFFDRNFGVLFEVLCVD